MILDQTKYLLNELKDTILRKHIDIDRLFQKVSVNHKITVMQFHYLLTAINPLIYLEDSYQVFKKIDRDNNNVIELHELREWFLDSQVLCLLNFLVVAPIVALDSAGFKPGPLLHFSSLKFRDDDLEARPDDPTQGDRRARANLAGILLIQASSTWTTTSI